MINYGQHFSTLKTPQTAPASPLQRVNNAGGYAFVLDPFDRLDRWLILGAEGGSYYVSEQKLTVDNARTVQECLACDGPRTVRRIGEISVSGRAPKNDPAIFALAMACSVEDRVTRYVALKALNDVCRTGTHLFTFLEYVKGFRGWGRGLRNAVARWYLAKNPEKLAYQVLKYQQRNGFSHRDALRLSHPLADDATMNGVLRYVVGKPVHETIELPALLGAYEQLKKAATEAEVIRLIERFPLSHDMIPTQWKKSPAVWEALVACNRVPLGALVRNLGAMTANGAIAPLSATGKLVAARLTDEDAVQRARLHPFSTLLAMRTYAQGHGEKGSLRWQPDRLVLDALDTAFYAGFGAIEPSGANTLIALDVSGSMGSRIQGTAITAREGAAAMAMATARTEKHYHTVAFTARSSFSGGGYDLYGAGISDLPISPRQRLDDITMAMTRLSFGRTDVALPILYALERRLDVDTFVVYTDNESYAGNVHPHQALNDYRRKTGKQDAKLIVVGMTATEFTVADPNDLGSLNVVGFDAAAPSVIADFSRKAKKD